MAFQEWLPVTARNRVALAFGVSSLVALVIWNCIPVPYHGREPNHQIFAVTLWPEIFYFEGYKGAFKSHDIRGMMSVAACFAILIASVMSLLVVPFWRFLHASPILRILVAIASLFGALIVLVGTVSGVFRFRSPADYVAISVMSASMFTLSVALFMFKNELALRSARENRISENEVGRNTAH